MPGPMTLAQKEQIARQNGFQNYEQMILWQRQRQVQGPGSVAGIKGASQPMPTTARGAADQAMSWHPAKIFNYISEALRGATGQ